MIPYKGPFRVTRVRGMVATLSDDVREFSANITKLVKLKNFLRLLVVSTEQKSELTELEDMFDRARELTDILKKRRDEGKVWKLAKKQLYENFPQLDAPGDDDKGLGEVDKLACEMLENQKILYKIAKAKWSSRVQIHHDHLKPGVFGIAWVKGQNRLMKSFEPKIC